MCTIAPSFLLATRAVNLGQPGLPRSSALALDEPQPAGRRSVTAVEAIDAALQHHLRRVRLVTVNGPDEHAKDPLVLLLVEPQHGHGDGVDPGVALIHRAHEHVCALTAAEFAVHLPTRQVGLEHAIVCRRYHASPPVPRNPAGAFRRQPSITSQKVKGKPLSLAKFLFL